MAKAAGTDERTKTDRQAGSFNNRPAPENHCLYQVNTRVLITDLSRQLGRPATLDDIPDNYLDTIAGRGFDWVYFLSVWQTGDTGRQVSRSHHQWRQGFQADLPDLKEDDICGSGFAISDYSLNESFGKPGELQRLRKKLANRGLKLMLDLVPNHTAIDHPWATSNPEFYVHGDEEAIARAPQNFIKVDGKILAHGRDPYFDGWPDTLQLDYGSPELRRAMRSQIERIAALCDGLRCDMAMLILPDVFKNTWGIDMEPFWPDTIAAIKAGHPDFVFMAEVYWDREWDLQQQGFNYTYDKRLYDRLRQGDAHAVREHFWADLDYQKHSARFLENHDEPRAASTFPPDQHKAAAVLTFLCPGLRFLHEGQFEGFKKHVSVHLNRRPDETANPEMTHFYESLMGCITLPAVRSGTWRLLECGPTWEGNWTHECFIAFQWADKGSTIIAVVNYSGNQAQCNLKIGDRADGMRSANPLLKRRQDIPMASSSVGDDNVIFLDLAPWEYFVASLTT
ncbi:MAG: alpha-amylase family glycosyl hydrolase [Candidatus Obscuribacterales bacterium]